MSRFESITIREVESSDLETFYEHQLDPEAIRMAAFVCKDPKDKVVFDAHWDKIDRKSTRLNSSHRCISYAVFCLKKKKTQYKRPIPPSHAFAHRTLLFPDPPSCPCTGRPRS